MNTPKGISILVAMIVALAMTLPNAYAQDNTQETQISFDQPVEIPGQVLPVGSYWFVLANNDFDRNIVRIYSADRSRVFATVQTEPTSRRSSDFETTFNLVDRPGRPSTLVNWFYTGESTGHEFVYSRSEERELARDMQRSISPREESQGYLGGE